MVKTQNNPTVGTTGGQLHGTFPVRGRFNAEPSHVRVRQQQEALLRQEEGNPGGPQAPAESTGTSDQQS
jgi:hypothetical protein